MPPDLRSTLEAFALLSGSRGAGLGRPLPIPLSEIESYCRLFGLTDPDDVVDLVELIVAMDTVYLDATARCATEAGGTERRSGPGKAKSCTGRRRN